MIRKSPHRTHRDERYFEIRCAALEVRVRELEASLKKVHDGTCPSCPDCNGCGNAHDISEKALATQLGKEANHEL